MPNHVTTICTVTGPDVAVFRAAHIRPIKDDGPRGECFDFKTIVPPPASIEGTESGSHTDHGFYALTGFIEPGTFIPRTVEMYRPTGYKGAMVPHEPVAAWLAEHQPETLELGRRSLAAFKETGHRDWYTWNCEHWGTKWGAYDYEAREALPGSFRFKFETAWAFPEPVFRKLAEMYPRLVFRIASFDEGWNFGCAGEFNGANDYHEVKPVTDALYREVYGREPEHEDADA